MSSEPTLPRSVGHTLLLEQGGHGPRSRGIWMEVVLGAVVTTLRLYTPHSTPARPAQTRAGSLRTHEAPRSPLPSGDPPGASLQPGGWDNDN